MGRPRPLPTVLLLLLLLVLCGTTGVQGQGSRAKYSIKSSEAASSQLASQYLTQMRRASELSRVFRSMSSSTKQSCLKNRRSRAALCSAMDSVLSDDALAIATAPQNFTWHGPQPAGVSSPFGPVGDQRGCWACVAFAVTAAAEAAVARVHNLPGGSVSMSEQDLNFCKAHSMRFCRSPWDISEALFALSKAVPVTRDCLPFSATPEVDTPGTCQARCSKRDARAADGRFTFREISNITAAQRQIRAYGSVISHMNLYKDFRPFFAANPRGVYDGALCTKGEASDLQEEHAVLLVGYNNKEGYWIARNSWGPRFADHGYFRIRMGVCGVAAVGQMFGISFVANKPPQQLTTVTPDPDIPGCFLYRAKQGDFLGPLSEIWGVKVVDLLANNTDIIWDLDAPLDGKLISICNPRNIKLPGGGSKPSPKPQQPPAGRVPPPPRVPTPVVPPKPSPKLQQPPAGRVAPPPTRVPPVVPPKPSPKPLPQQPTPPPVAVGCNQARSGIGGILGGIVGVQQPGTNCAPSTGTSGVLPFSFPRGRRL